MNVLIVDDSKAMQNIITKSMKGIGYINDTYIYANDGEEALRMIRNDSPDLVLCDMHMPKMTGVDLLRALRNENNLTRMIIVSIDNDPKTIANITALGGDAYLKKPFTSEQLFHTVSSLFDKNIEKKTKTAQDVAALIPHKPVLERVMSSLAASDVQFVEAQFAEIDFDRSPFYVGTFQNEQGHIKLGIFLDALAANTIAAIINRKPLKTALEAAQAKRIDATAVEAMLAFLGVFSGLCAPAKSGQLLDIHAQHIAEDGHAHLSQHLLQYAETASIYSINCGVCRGGKIILI